jgi:hypothetical protein
LSLSLTARQVNPDDLSNDSDPAFVSEFYTNLKILSQDLYKKSSHSSSSSSSGQQAASTPSERRVPLLRTGSKGGSLGVATAAAVPTGDYFSTNNLSERIRNYVRVSNVPQEFAERYLLEESTHQSHGTASGATSGGVGAAGAGQEESDEQRSVNKSNTAA